MYDFEDEKPTWEQDPGSGDWIGVAVMGLIVLAVFGLVFFLVW